jgi:hypothetical protein
MTANSSLLISDKPLLVLPRLAKAIGLNEAIVLQQVQFWLGVHEGIQRNFVDGRYWVYNSYEQWKEQFYFWHRDTIRRTIKSLEDQELLISACLSPDKGDRTKWYTINYERLKEIEAANPPFSSSVQIAHTIGANCTDHNKDTETTTECSSRAQPSENSQDEKTKLARWIKNTAPGVEIYMDEINYWLDEGCDIENHIKPIIKRMVLRAIENDQTIGSIYYFRKAILNIKNKKLPKASEPEQSDKEFSANKEDLLKSTKEKCDHPAWHAMCEWALKTFGYRDFFSYFSRPVGVKVDEDTDLLRISVEGGYTRQHWNENYKEDLEQIAYENGLDGVEIS